MVPDRVEKKGPLEILAPHILTIKPALFADLLTSGQGYGLIHFVAAEIRFPS
jgi:hypothetical protein